MEVCQVTRVKIYSLRLNPVTDRFESLRIMAVSTQFEPLFQWYQEQYQGETWEDPQPDGRVYRKRFRRGSPLEWCNPCYNTDIGADSVSNGGGFDFEWVSEEAAEDILQRPHDWQVICRD